MKKICFPILTVLFILSSCTTAPGKSDRNLTIQSVMFYDSGIYDESAAEIVAFDRENKQILCTNGADGSLTLLSVEDGNLVKTATLSFTTGDANSVSVHGNIAAVAVAASNKTEPGKICFINLAEGTIAGEVTVGALPDMVQFTPNGEYLLAANEGEPSIEYTADPVGSVSIIKVNNSDYSASTVTNLTFGASDLTADLSGTKVRTHEYLKNMPVGFSVAQDIEPEYIAVDSASRYAYVTCQENNAIAKIDIAKSRVIMVKSLGFKDYSRSGIDCSSDGVIDIKPRPVYGLYMPDAITSFTIAGKTYLATANEGDDRADWEDNTKVEDHDCTKVKNLEDFGLVLDTVFLDSEGEILDEYKNLKVSPFDCLDTDNDGDIDILASLGGRSFSIWNEELNLVFDSGSLFEEYTAEIAPDVFNCSNDNLEMEDRSTKKGPEPEAITFGEINGVPLLFVGLERFGGFFVFDVSRPSQPEMILYQTERNFSADINEKNEYDDVSLSNTGDLGPEGFDFVPAEESITGNALLIVGSEVSGTVRVYDLTLKR